MTHENKLKCKEIIKHYGIEHQLNKLIEELGELVQATAKYRNDLSEENRIHFAEEMADVRIMLAQLKSVAGEEDVDEFVQKKLDRQLKRIKKELKNETVSSMQKRI